jgi:hypothetical protein
VNLDFDELPGYLVLNRLSKTAKENNSESCTNGSFYWDSHLIVRLAILQYLFKEFAAVAHHDDECDTLIFLNYFVCALIVFLLCVD